MSEKLFTCHQMIADYSTGEDLDFDFLQELIDEQKQPKDLRMHISDGNKIITYRECVDLLNELSTDCRQLKKENEELKQDCTTLIYHNQEYRKENEQLKEELADANELKRIYVDFLVDKGFELSDVVEWSRS